MKTSNFTHQQISLLLALAIMPFGFQNCSNVKFSPATATSSASTQSTPIPPADTDSHPTTTAATCTPSSTSTPVITTLPAGVTAATISTICPSIGYDSECGVVIIVTDSGRFLYYTGQGPYDGSDDTLVGILNISSTPLNSINVQSTLDITGFDDDGLVTYQDNNTGNFIHGNKMDATGYGGPNAYFSNLPAKCTAKNKLCTSGTVNFLTPVAASVGKTYFALENNLTSTSSCLQIQ